MKNAILIVLALLLAALPLLATAAENAHAAEAGGEASHVEQTYFGMPAWLLKLINIVVFLGLLGYLLKGPVSSAFKARGEQIRAELEEAKERNAKADRLAADIQSRLDQIEADVTAIVERAKVDGEKQKIEIIEAARLEAEKILAAARGEVDSRIKQARKELTEYAGQLAADKAHEVLNTSMTDADRKKVFADSVRAIEETRA
ncbi:MAG: ATP synthase F0 subunit B [Acidobacteria bacterium]|nr:ATP synthase F0 subunit B [Acidobacteriota bacterium]